jgi:DNA-nicking Smr family endonuclease
MDHRTYQKISRGKLRPDARIDLHDLTAAQAHQALIAFIINAHAQKKRLVLVITGKGKARPDYGPIPERVGILRQFLPHWVSTPPLKPYIQSLRQAHQRDGGLGAFYVYLRK